MALKKQYSFLIIALLLSLGTGPTARAQLYTDSIEDKRGQYPEERLDENALLLAGLAIWDLLSHAQPTIPEIDESLIKTSIDLPQDILLMRVPHAKILAFEKALHTRRSALQEVGFAGLSIQRYKKRQALRIKKP